jgi:hypothetical protein
MGLAQVESWIIKISMKEHGTVWLGDSWAELSFIRQSAAFLVIGNKPQLTLEDITIMIALGVLQYLPLVLTYQQTCQQ